MAAADETSFELFKEALAIPGTDCWPFDLARVQLAYGERLRRVGPPTQSRVQLRSALETFERLGARPWANRAATELRATGQAKPRGVGFPREGLTPQEREIAMLARPVSAISRSDSASTSPTGRSALTCTVPSPNLASRRGLACATRSTRYPRSKAAAITAASPLLIDRE
jgi:hypothetical protein